MHVIIGGRKDARLAADALDLIEQKLRVAPTFTAAILLRQPARAHVAEAVNQEFHVRRRLPQNGRAGVAQGTPEQQVGGRRLLCPSVTTVNGNDGEEGAPGKAMAITSAPPDCRRG